MLLVALVVLVVAVGALTFARFRGGGPPELLARTLEVMPAPAAGAGLYFTAQAGTLESVYGFAPGRVEPTLERTYGIRGDDVTAVLESGGPATTVLLGSFAVDDIAGAFADLGYTVEESGGGWTQLVGGDQVQGPLAAGAEAVALRRDAVVIGTAAETAAVVRDETPEQWDQVLRMAPAEASVVAFGPSYDEMVGDKVASPDAEGGAERYVGWLLAFWGDGERREGVVVQQYDGARAAVAGELAGRIGAAPVIGTAPGAIRLEPQEPRWDADSGIATVSVTATGSAAAWAQLRDVLERGEAGFLRQP